MQAFLVREDVASCVGVSTLHHHTRGVRDEAVGIENTTRDGVVEMAWTTAPVGSARLKVTARARMQTSIFRWTINHHLAGRFRTSKKYSPLSGRKPTPRSRLCQFAQRSNFSRIINPSQQSGSHSDNVWKTNELQHGWLRGADLGSGARYYTDQSGDLLDTFSIPAYGLVDVSIFYCGGPLGWQVNAYNLADERYFTGSHNDVYVQPGNPRSIHTTISWKF